MFATVDKVRALLNLEIEARLKTLDPSAPPQDFIEAFLIRMEEVNSSLFSFSQSSSQSLSERMCDCENVMCDCENVMCNCVNAMCDCENAMCDCENVM